MNKGLSNFWIDDFLVMNKKKKKKMIIWELIQ